MAGVPPAGAEFGGKPMRPLFLCLCAVACVGSSAFAQLNSGPLQIQEHVLDNGFTILLVEDHRRPRVAANLWVRVGSMAEPVGQHGITHFLEHVIHQGTTTVGTSDLAAELPILREIHDTEQELIAVRNRERNQLRERAVFYDELGWPVTPEIEALRERLYELEDRDDEYRDFWTSYKWYMQHGGYVRHTDPVPASTEQDYMEMNMALPKEHLELFFRLEADRLVNAILRGWEAQRFTVLEQILGGKSNPQTRFNEAIDGVTAQVHPVYVPDGGHVRDFGNFTRDAMYRIYDDYFVPNNAALVLVGDVTLDEVVPLAERYFGVLPRGPEPPLDLDVEAEPVPSGSVRLDWTEPLSPQVHLRYRIPGMGHPDRPVFDLIAALLSGPHGMAGQALAASGASASVAADFRVIHTYRFGSPAAFNLVAQAETDGDLAAVEGALLDAVADLREGRIDSAALARAHKRLRVEWAELLDNTQELAFLVGHHHTMNHWSVLPDLIEARDAATAADVQRVAATYFVPSNRVIAVARAEPPEGSGPSWLDFVWSEAAGRRAMRFWQGTAGLQTGSAARKGCETAYRHPSRSAGTAWSADLRSARAGWRPAHGESHVGPHGTQARDRRSSDRHRSPQGAAKPRTAVSSRSAGTAWNADLRSARAGRRPAHALRYPHGAGWPSRSWPPQPSRSAGCGGEDTLPGRSRPIFEHDWPDPGDLASGPSAFTPPDPGEALFEAASGVRAYIVPAEADPLVRITAALPLGRLHEAEGEAGAAALLTHLLTTRGPAGNEPSALASPRRTGHLAERRGDPRRHPPLAERASGGLAGRTGATRGTRPESRPRRRRGAPVPGGPRLQHADGRDRR